MSMWIVASLLLCREREEGNEWTRASQASVNLFKLGFFSSFNASLEVCIVYCGLLLCMKLCANRLFIVGKISNPKRAIIAGQSEVVRMFFGLWIGYLAG